jgi:competence protein ComGF
VLDACLGLLNLCSPPSAGAPHHEEQAPLLLGFDSKLLLQKSETLELEVSTTKWRWDIQDSEFYNKNKNQIRYQIEANIKASYSSNNKEQYKIHSTKGISNRY